MKGLHRITSDDGNISIDIVETRKGVFELYQYANKYDLEEDKFYEIRVFPGPSGKYGDFETAVNEAQVILHLDSRC